MDAQGVRRALRPALPGERPTLPEETHLWGDLVPESPTSRLFRLKDDGRRVLRADDAPAADAFSAPRHPLLVAPRGLVRIRRALFIELEGAGAPLPTSRVSPRVAVARVRTLIEALGAWWGTSAPDVLSGEWVGLGRDQLRLRDDGTLALVPTLTRRLSPDAFALPELAGVPLAWSRTMPMIVRLAAAVLFELLAGLSLLDAHVGSAMAVHQRLALRLRHPPSLAGVEPARFDDVLAQALRQPASLSPEDFLRRVAALATSGPSSPG